MKKIVLVCAFLAAALNAEAATIVQCSVNGNSQVINPSGDYVMLDPVQLGKIGTRNVEVRLVPGRRNPKAQLEDMVIISANKRGFEQAADGQIMSMGSANFVALTYIVGSPVKNLGNVITVICQKAD